MVSDNTLTEDGHMSWSLQYTSKADFEADVPAYPDADPRKGTTEAPTDEAVAIDAARADQIRAARAVAKALIELGVVGAAGGFDFYVNISGHANVGHAPASGWANDCISVSVAQK